jgi:hypothetical protein
MSHDHIAPIHLIPLKSKKSDLYIGIYKDCMKGTAEICPKIYFKETSLYKIILLHSIGMICSNREKSIPASRIVSLKF